MTVAAPVGALAGIGGGSLLFLTTWALLAATGALAKPEPVSAARRFWSTIVLLVLLSGVEELLFRGLFLGEGIRIAGVVAALLVSSAAFAASHAFPTPLAPRAWLNLGLYGVVFGLAYLVGGLPASIGMHAAWNAWEWGTGFTVSGPSTSRLLPMPPVRRHVKSTPYGPEGHVTATVVSLAAILAMLLTIHPLLPR